MKDLIDYQQLSRPSLMFVYRPQFSIDECVCLYVCVCWMNNGNLNGKERKYIFILREQCIMYYMSWFEKEQNVAIQ